MSGYSDVMWAICHPGGFYCGTWLTRVEAIQAHVEAYTGLSERGRYLTSEQRAEWESRKRRGDRAIQVVVKEYKRRKAP